MKSFCVNKREEFILIKLKDFCKKKSISIKYTAPYIYKKNSLVKQKLKIIVNIKDLLFIDNRLLFKI